MQEVSCARGCTTCGVLTEVSHQFEREVAETRCALKLMAHSVFDIQIQNLKRGTKLPLPAKLELNILNINPRIFAPVGD